MIVDIRDEILLGVEKPARYTGGEVNSVKKQHGPDMVEFAFCFPDVYEVGMSHLGGQILYEIINNREDALCERIYAPWVDMEEKMRENGLPLFSLETKTAASDFDVLGFTLQYEMSYTNILNMLDLSGIPVDRMDRDNEGPLVCAGGPCVFNPEPLARFIDFFLIGEGEEKINTILDMVKKKKTEGLTKRRTLELLSKTEGIYVPSVHDDYFNQAGERTKDFTSKIKKVLITDMDDAPYPEKPVVPFINIVHDRAMMEIFRGCIRGCRFCQAGFIYRPVREKSEKRLLEEAKKKIGSTGYDEISLSSLSTSDYSGLGRLTEDLIGMTEPVNVSLSLPSLRVDNFSMDLMKKVQKVRKSGLTFAPEAGTQRLRDVINKNVTEEEVMNAAKLAFEGGWTTLKLYFMLGLPTETMEDIEGIADLAGKLKRAYREYAANSKKPLNLTVSTAIFVPKPFTPFQWERQITIEEMKERQTYLYELLKRERVRYNWHDFRLSRLEGIIARGDGRTGEVIKKAWIKGSRFDGWSDRFNYENWREAIAEVYGDSDTDLNGERNEDEIFPWDFIDIGVNKSFLLKERHRAYKGETTPNCREECMACGAAVFGGGVCFEHNKDQV